MARAWTAAAAVVTSMAVAGMAALCDVGVGAAASGSSWASSTVWQRVDARCEPLARQPLPPYPWPLKPFDRQHAVRGNFGDPRTVWAGEGSGLFAFHNGIDISAWEGSKVYAVVSGRVVEVDADRVVVAASHRRRFQYIHILPRVHVGEQVVASRAVIGSVLPRWGHVHLSEIRGGCAVNPLEPGHLTPYRDRTRPQVQRILFEDVLGQRLSPTRLSGEVRLIAEAQDEPALAPPGPWQRMPVTPAFIGWRIATVRGTVLARGVGADFRYSEPPQHAFWEVYAPGTVQNFAAVDDVFRWAQPGRYLFNLTPRFFDTRSLDPGRYLLTVVARDTAGNSAALTTRINVYPEPNAVPLGLQSSPASVLRQCKRAEPSISDASLRAAAPTHLHGAVQLTVRRRSTKSCA